MARKPGATDKTAEHPAVPPVHIFVRIGALRRFDAMKRKTADLPVIVSWDRRRTERRAASRAARRSRVATSPVGKNRRECDRRHKPPFTWEIADFVVVEEP